MGKIGVVFVIALSGCVGWAAREPKELRADDEPAEYLVVTSDVAYHLKDVTVISAGSGSAVELGDIRGTSLRGTTVHAWLVPADTGDISTLDDLEPNAIARVRGWQPIDRLDAAHLAVHIDVPQIQSFRRYEDHSRRGVAVVGVPILLTLLVGVIAIATHPAASCGRPLRVRGRRKITPLAASDEWIAPIELQPVADEVRPTLIQIWTEEAQAEHAAIAAFSKLSLELLALGAPPELVTRANKAALQEIQHARLCFGVASAYSGRRLGPGPLPQALEGDTVDIDRIAREAVVDGCLREGLAAEIARIGASTAQDPALVRVLKIQASEETQHAELGWAIVEWCISRDGERMRTLLLAAVAEARAPRGDDLPEHGRVSRTHVKQLFDESCARTRDRLTTIATTCAAA